MNKWQETIGHTLSMEDFFLSLGMIKELFSIVQGLKEKILKFNDKWCNAFNSLGKKKTF